MIKDKIIYPEVVGDRRFLKRINELAREEAFAAVDKRLSKLERVFLKLVDLVSRGEIIDISIDAEEDGTRVGTVRWRRKS